MTDFDSISLGQKAERSTLISAKLVADFAALTGDDNPVHLDEQYAAKSIFGRRVAHGMIASSLIASLMGSELPGWGTIYLGQNLEFRAPVFIDDTVTVSVEVLEKDDKTKRIKLKTQAVNQDGRLVINGQALVLYK
ncbi:MAG: MaoC family dehydratase [Deltaproteobacteria bacterium]|nr:MaoC family dehydratase [Deltaproteobacteria bacterium]